VARVISTLNLIDEALDMRELALVKLRRERPIQLRMRAEHAMATGVQWDAAEDTAMVWLKHAEIMLKTAETFVWTKDTAKYVIQAANKLPDDVPFHRAWLPCACGFWWLGRDSPWKVKTSAGLDDDPTLPEERTVCAVTYYAAGGDFADERQRNHILFECLSFEHGESRGPTSVMGAAWEEGETLTQFLRRVRDMTPANRETIKLWNEGVETAARLIMAACLWMQQRVVSIRSGIGSRPNRRRLERQDINSTTKIIVLRRYESEHNEPTGTGQELQWRVPVIGHWRNQFYGTLGYTIPIWIEDHWRGPKDAPVKAPSKVIYKVAR
jgi:hypothetical protein